MRAHLVFSPFTSVSVPLGITSLKSYLEANSAHHVRCFDFNHLANLMIINSAKDKDTIVDGDNNSAADFTEAFSVFSGQSQDFYDQDKF